MRHRALAGWLPKLSSFLCQHCHRRKILPNVAASHVLQFAYPTIGPCCDIPSNGQPFGPCFHVERSRHRTDASTELKNERGIRGNIEANFSTYHNIHFFKVITHSNKAKHIVSQTHSRFVWALDCRWTWSHPNLHPAKKGPPIDQNYDYISSKRVWLYSKRVMWLWTYHLFQGFSWEYSDIDWLWHRGRPSIPSYNPFHPFLPRYICIGWSPVQNSRELPIPPLSDGNLLVVSWKWNDRAYK